jgi:hypothetical protein
VYLVAAVTFDHMVAPHLDVSLAEGGTSQVNAVLTTVAALTGLLALAVSVSTTPLAAVLERYSPSVAAPLLVDESRDRLLRLVIATFTFSVGLLLVSAVGWSTPIGSALVAALLGIRVLVLLTAYIRQRVALLHPSALASELALQMRSWLVDATNQPASRSVSTYVRRRYAANFRLLVKMCSLEAGHRLEDEATEVLRSMSHAVAEYMRLRRYIDLNSEWFPIRDVPVAGFDLTVSPMYEQLGLGTPLRPERHVDWFEEQVKTSWQRLARIASETHTNDFALALVESTRYLMIEAVEQQELTMLTHLCDVAEDLAGYIASLPAATEVANAVIHVQHALEQGLRVESAQQSIADANYSVKSIRQARLPTVITMELLRMGQQLRTETWLVKKQVTPRAQASKQVVTALQTAETKMRTDFGKRLISVLQRLSDASRESGQLAGAYAAVAGLALVAERQLQSGEAAAALAIATDLRPQVEALPTATTGLGGARGAALDRVRVLSLKAIVANEASVSEQLLPGLLLGLIQDQQYEDVLAVAALAHLRSEISNDDRYQEAVRLSGINWSAFADVLLGADGRRRGIISPQTGMRYHSYLVEMGREIEAMPRRVEHLSGHVIPDEVVDHASSLVQQLGSHPAMLGLETCIRSLLKALSEPSAADPET